MSHDERVQRVNEQQREVLEQIRANLQPANVPDKPKYYRCVAQGCITVGKLYTAEVFGRQHSAYFCDEHAPKTSTDTPSVHRVKLEPGDTLVLTFPGNLGMEACERIDKHMAKVFPGHELIILQDGMTLSVVSESAAPKELQDNLLAWFRLSDEQRARAWRRNASIEAMRKAFTIDQEVKAKLHEVKGGDVPVPSELQSAVVQTPTDWPVDDEGFIRQVQAGWTTLADAVDAVADLEKTLAGDDAVKPDHTSGGS